MKKNWNNLAEKKCPICSYKLEQNTDYHPTYVHVQQTQWVCPNTTTCEGFRIGEKRMKEIVAGVETRRFDEQHSEENNFERLQNL